MTVPLKLPRQFCCKLAALLVLLVLLVVSHFLLAARAAPPANNSLAAHIPGGAFTFIETTGLAKLVSHVRSSDLLSGLLQSEDFAILQQSDSFKEFNSAKGLVEFVLRMSLWEASTKLFGGRVGCALYPGGDGGRGEPEIALLVHPSESSDWLKSRVWSAPLLRLGLKRIERTAFGGRVAAYRTRGDADKGIYFAFHNNWIVIASNIDLLKQTVVLQLPEKTQLGAPGLKLGDELAFQQMTVRMGAAHLGRAFIDTQRVAKATGANLGLPKQIRDPMLSLFLGGVAELVENSRFAGFALDLEGKQLRFTAGIDARPQDVAEAYRIFFSENPRTGMQALPEVPGLIGGFTLYRQFGDWYRGRDDVLKDSLIPGIEGFQGNIGDILLGKAGDKIGSPIIGDRVAFVSAMRDDAGAEEGSKAALPGFAFVVDLATTDGVDLAIVPIFDAVLDELRGADRKKFSWQRDTETYRSVRVRFARGNSGGRTLIPAVARVGDKLVVSSSRQLCHDLIAKLQDPAPALVEGKDLVFDLRSASLEGLLKLNRKQYHSQLLHDGRSPKQAADDLKNIENVLAVFNSLQGSTSAAGGAFELNVHGQLK